MRYSIDSKYDTIQMDSICNIEKIPYDFSRWINTGLIDYETNDSVYIYTYIKQIDKNREIVYRVVKVDSLYKFTKREVINSK